MRMDNVKAATSNVNGAIFYVKSAVFGWDGFGPCRGRNDGVAGSGRWLVGLGPSLRSET